jgi:hypothetical protein
MVSTPPPVYINEKSVSDHKHLFLQNEKGITISKEIGLKLAKLRKK